jgi:hypothetical protein
MNYLIAAGFSLVLLICASCKKANASDPPTNANAANAIKVIPKSVLTNAAYIQTAEAGEVLKQLHSQGLLPGVAKDEHGRLSSDTIPMTMTNGATVIKYPETQTFHFVKTGGNTIINYTMVRVSKDSAWQLQRAWQTDPQSHATKELPVK